MKKFIQKYYTLLIVCVILGVIISAKFAKEDYILSALVVTVVLFAFGWFAAGMIKYDKEEFDKINKS